MSNITLGPNAEVEIDEQTGELLIKTQADNVTFENSNVNFDGDADHQGNDINDVGALSTEKLFDGEGRFDRRVVEVETVNLDDDISSVEFDDLGEFDRYIVDIEALDDIDDGLSMDLIINDDTGSNYIYFDETGTRVTNESSMMIFEKNEDSSGRITGEIEIRDWFEDGATIINGVFGSRGRIGSYSDRGSYSVTEDGLSSINLTTDADTLFRGGFDGSVTLYGVVQ